MLWIDFDRYITLARMGYFPTRLQRFLAVTSFAGMLIFIVAMSLDWRMAAAAAGLIFMAAACALSVADVGYLLRTRRGYGRVSGHITEKDHPISFKLHVVLASMLALLWGIGVLLGAIEVLN
jgi:hypothetical protein